MLREESRDELVVAFLEGGMSRRTLIRRLVAGGVSVGAAVSYARLLKPERASAAVGGDLYPLVKMSILSTDLDVVIAEDRVKVEVISTEEIADARFRSLFGVSGGLRGLGKKTVAPFLSGAGTKNVFVPVDGGAIGDRQDVKMYVHLKATDADSPGHESLAIATKTIQR